MKKRMRTYTPCTGGVFSALQEAVALAKKHGENVRLKINGTRLFAKPHDTPAAIMKRYIRKSRSNT